FTPVELDPITVDLVEKGFENVLHRMNALIFRVSMSPLMREQRDSFPILTDRHGAQMAGQFGSPVQRFLDHYDGTVGEGDIVKILLGNSRTPHWIRADLNALVSGARLGRNAIVEMATRFGVDELYSAIDALKTRCHNAMRQVIRTLIPEQRTTFEDYLCDDG